MWHRTPPRSTRQLIGRNTRVSISPSQGLRRKFVFGQQLLRHHNPPPSRSSPRRARLHLRGQETAPKATRTLGREGPVQLLTRGVSRYLEGREDLSGFAGDERAGFGVCAGERWGLVLAGERNPSPRGGKGVGFGSVFEFVLSQRVVMGLRPVTFSRAMTSWPLQHHVAEEYFSFLVESGVGDWAGF